MQALALCPERTFPVALIDPVSQQGMSDVCHMDPDLVGPAGLQAAFHIGVTAETLQDPDMGHGPFAVRADRHLFSVFGIPADGPVNDQLVFFQASVDNGVILPDNGMVLELGRDAVMGSVIFADNDRAGPGRRTPLIPDSWSRQRYMTALTRVPL